MTSTENIIVVRDLTKRFGSFLAVNHVTFDIKKGEILGFLGPNGAGKTTIIKMIIGLFSISSGTVFVKGIDNCVHLNQIKRLIGYMSQKFSLYPLLTSLENIEFAGGIFRLSRPQILLHQKEVSLLVPEKLLRIKVKDLPPGIRQKVALHVCLMTDPEIILLDEPTSGVDPQVRREFWSDIYRLKKSGKTILVTTHYLDEAEYADRILLINRGELILEGEPQALKERRGALTMENLFKQAIDRHEQA